MEELLWQAVSKSSPASRGGKKNPAQPTWIYRWISVVPVLLMKHLFCVRCSEQPQTVRGSESRRELQALEQVFGEKK